MKKFFLFIAMACSGLLLKAQDDKQPYMVKSLSSEVITNAKLEASGGGISVTGVSASEARLEVFVTPNNNQHLTKEEIQQRLDEYYTINISASNHQLVASVRPKNSNSMNWKRAVNISFKAYLPVNVNTDLETSGGGISLSNLNGTQIFRTSGGGIDVENVKGKMKGRGSGGGIEITNSSNDIDLVTSGGGISAKGCTGNVRLHTSGGSLHLEDLDGDIEAGTSGGSIDADGIKGELSASTSGGSIRLTNLLCKVEAETSGGGISAEIKDTAKDVKLRNSGGDIVVQLPANKGFDIDLNANKINVELKNFSGSAEEHSIVGTLYGGGALIDVHSSGGRVDVRFR
ncbi:MAG TPA: DUF4097 family beta strand repeat-containing protein [Parafilimonas sp.]|nr:DUF4097 family beta strand repeat-containing protein [Parafilimonas sp.]